MIAVFGIVDAKLKCLPFYWVIEWCYGLVVSYYNFFINCYMKCKCIFIDTPLSYYAKGKKRVDEVTFKGAAAKGNKSFITIGVGHTDNIKLRVKITSKNKTFCPQDIEVIKK